MRKYFWLSLCCVFALAVFALLYVFEGRASADSDYMSAGLRKQVEQLKQDVHANPTTAATLDKHLTVLWDWLNAYAMTGKSIDPYLPGFVSAVRETMAQNKPHDKIEYQGVPAAKVLDNFVYVLSLLEEDPHAVGDIAIDSRGPYLANSHQTVRVTYVVGNAGIKTGGGVLIGQHLMPDNMYFQSKDPAADNYVTAHASRAGVTLKPEPIDFRGFYGRSSYLGEPTIFRLMGGELVKGDKITIIYGDKSAGSAGLYMPSYANDRIPFQLYLALDGSDRFISLPLVSVETLGMSVAGVHGFAPSIVEPGEAFAISIRSQDQYYNRATGPIPAYDVFLNGQKFKEIAAGGKPITLIENIKLAKEGVYHFTIKSKDGAISGVANPVLVQKNPPYRIFWGETHAHSGMAEGIGSTKAFWTYGRDDARLDFLAHTDHDAQMDDYEWSIVRQNAIDFYEPGKFIPFLAYEFSSDWEIGGHHNVLFRTPQNRNRVPNQIAPLLSALHKRLLAENNPEDVLVIPHAHNPGDWRLSEPKLESLVEIMSGHGTFEWFGQQYLKQGYHVGFVGGSDDHISHPGYSSPWHRAAGMFQVGGLAAVMASEKTPDALFDSLKARRNYATTGERMLLFVNLNGAVLGSRIPFSPSRKVEGRVIGTGPLESLTIVKNGKAVFTEDWLTETSAAVPSEVRVQVAFYSDSFPPNFIRETPRGPRPWRGTVTVSGAQLAQVASLDADNPRLQQIGRVKGSDDKIEFNTLTRGQVSSMIIDLKNATPDTTITLHVEGAKLRRASGPGALSVDGDTVARQRITVTLKDMAKGWNKKTLPAGAYEDVIMVRRLKPADILEKTFSFTDTDSFTPGDYYYVRVTQLDGAIAWSSPIWVGDYPSR